MAKITGIEGQPLDHVTAQVDAGARFVVFEYVFSILVMTFRRRTDIFFVPAGRSAKDLASEANTITLMLGWWGIPWGPIWSFAALARNAQGGHDVTAEVMAHLGAAAPRRASPEHLSRHCLACLSRWKNDPQDTPRVARLARQSGVAAEDLEVLLDQVDVFAIECAVRRILGASDSVKEGLTAFATALEREFGFGLADYNRFEAAVRAAAYWSDEPWHYLVLDELASAVATSAFETAKILSIQPEGLDAVAGRFCDHLNDTETSLLGLSAE